MRKVIEVLKYLVIEIENDVEVIIRKKRTRRNFLQLLKDNLRVESWDSQYKNDAINDIHHRITFK